MDFLLDPHVLAVPDSFADEVALSKYIDTMKRWLVASSMDKHKLWFTSYMTKALNKHNVFPYPNVIRDRCSRVLTNKHKSDLLTLSNVIHGRLMQPPHLDKHLNAIEPDLDLIDSVVLPREIEERLSKISDQDVAHALKKSLVMMGIESAKNNSEIAQNIFFATNPIEAVNQVEVCINQLGENADMEKINAAWALLTHPDDLDDVDGLLNFWNDTQRALDWAFKKLCANNCLGEKPKRFAPKVGKKFNQSIIESHNDKSLTVLEALFRNAVLAHNDTGGFERFGKNHHELREGDESTKPQKVRAADGATAWRVHLCGATRLHYWQLEDGNIELSRVTKGNNHDDFYIA